MPFSKDEQRAVTRARQALDRIPVDGSAGVGGLPMIPTSQRPDAYVPAQYAAGLDATLARDQRSVDGMDPRDWTRELDKPVIDARWSRLALTYMQACSRARVPMRVREYWTALWAMADAGLVVPGTVVGTTLNNLPYPSPAFCDATPAELAEAWARLAAADGLLVEGFVPFEAEVAVTVARSPSGETVAYPTVRSEHRDHRLHAATLPSGFPPDVEAEAQRVALAATEALGTVGVATVELFVQPGGVLVNEVAPRPHNTAHGTIEACHTSQFENHVRAVLGLPLGSPALRVPAACTVNVIGGTAGTNASDLEAALRVEGASVHLYGKTESHPRRKMGHVTATAATADEARRRAEVAAEHLRQR